MVKYSVVLLLLSKVLLSGSDSTSIPTTVADESNKSQMETTTTESPELSSLHMYMYAASAVVFISLVGLFTILLVPLIQPNHHSNIIQLLVGLAIGTLTSDAMLHLLPHAFSHQVTCHDHSHDDEHHANEHSHDGGNVWYGLMALMTIIGFLAIERGMTILSDLRNKSRSKASSIGNCSRAVGEKLSNHGDSDPTSPTELEKLNDTIKVNEESRTLKTDTADGGCLPRSNGQSNEIQMTTEQCHRETRVYHHPDPERGYVVQLTDHHHHHQRQNQRGAKSMIYMIVTGDGLHNFFDGLAIGVAFAGGGLGGGLSTSIAVLCHELPHEVGDFAVLIKAGLSVKKAILYNTLSSFLCFVGMTVGVFVGKMDDALISGAIAGMFLYIALVDMIPQLDCCPTQSGSTRAFKLSVQLVGISIGVAIMSLISLYETRLRILLN